MEDQNEIAQNDQEKALLISLKTGSEEAFTILYKKYREPVYNYCLLLTKSEPIAKDIVQQVFIAVWLKCKTVNSELPFGPFLFAIAKNRIKNYFRNLSRHRLLRENWLRTCCSSENTTESILAGNETRLVLSKAIASLSQQRRVVFTMSRIQGKSNEEIAIVMGLSKNTIKNHLAESVRQIKQYLSLHSDIQLSIAILFLFQN